MLHNLLEEIFRKSSLFDIYVKLNITSNPPNGEDEMIRIGNRLIEQI